MDVFEKVVRPIVEGQLRGFVKEHPEILRGVTWFKNGAQPTKSFVGSIAKRIVRDLVCPTGRARMAAALLEASAGATSIDVADIPIGASPPGASRMRLAPADTPHALPTNNGVMMDNIIEISVDQDRAKQVYEAVEKLLIELGQRETLSIRPLNREELLWQENQLASEWYREHEKAIHEAGIGGAPEFMIPF